MRRLLSRISAAAVLAVAGCHTCDVCDDCGDGYGCGGGYGASSHHARNYGDPGFAPGYATPEFEGTVTDSSKRIPMQTLQTTPKKTIAAQPTAQRVIR